ncbi:MAG TPA: GAF domain-containing protein, partial [Chitinophagaceae bacterium]
PLLSLALLKNRDTFADSIEKTIKEKFTALQPSVEWKFANVAWEYMQKSRSGMPVSTGNVAFENVYPLYGAIDVRNSSLERSAAIQKDTKAQLDLIDDTLDKLQSMVQLPLLEGLRFKNQNLRQAINEALHAEDEVRINDFFENEAGPVLQHLQKCNLKTQEVVESYFNQVNDCSSYLHRYRNEYETALAAINNAVLAYLEEEEEKLQQSYPHYFEKYRTDGVEYNIYIGQSIAPANPFDTLYLRNIRLWQLRSMAEIARITHRLLPSLPAALQTTQLLLVHNQPISISFRKDERRFDVEGSYNIRYEIMKKRLDKVRIKDTNERLTQPGKIALVYSNPKEAQEYGEYIQFLQSKKILSAGTEFLDLEELQGVTGLKALRVSIEVDE